MCIFGFEAFRFTLRFEDGLLKFCSEGLRLQGNGATFKKGPQNIQFQKNAIWYLDCFLEIFQKKLQIINMLQKYFH